MERITGPIETPEGPSAAFDSDEAGRTIRTRWAYGGFAIGTALGFVVTAADVATRGYHVLPFQLVWNLIWAPYLGAVVGFGLSRTRRTGPRWWRRPQLRTRTLMVVVAYVALLFGVGVSTRELGDAARRHYQKSVTSAFLAGVYRGQARKSEGDAGLRRANVAGLRAGEVPAGLLPIQREFLRSLEEDAKVTPAHREYRRDLITEGEEQARARQEHNVVLFRRLGAYYEKLAAKYERARWRPWLPVEADPPVPK